MAQEESVGKGRSFLRRRTSSAAARRWRWQRQRVREEGGGFVPRVRAWGRWPWPKSGIEEEAKPKSPILMTATCHVCVNSTPDHDSIRIVIRNPTGIE